MFKVGQRVTCAHKNKTGTVVTINPSSYPITVGFDDGDIASYTHDGRYMSHSNIVLFHAGDADDLLQEAMLHPEN